MQLGEQHGHDLCSAAVEGPLPFPPFVATKRKLALEHPIWAAGNVERELLAKQVPLSALEDGFAEQQESMSAAFSCPIVACRALLRCPGELDAHYAARHMAACSVCSRSYPTARLLGLHVAESHDSFFQAKVAARHAMYECLVEGCGHRFVSAAARAQHLADKHHFPRNFRFSRPGRHLSQRQRAACKDPLNGGAMDRDRSAVHTSGKQIEAAGDGGTRSTRQIGTVMCVSRRSEPAPRSQGDAEENCAAEQRAGGEGFPGSPMRDLEMHSSEPRNSEGSSSLAPIHQALASPAESTQQGIWRDAAAADILPGGAVAGKQRCHSLDTSASGFPDGLQPQAHPVTEGDCPGDRKGSIAVPSRPHGAALVAPSVPSAKPLADCSNDAVPGTQGQASDSTDMDVEALTAAVSRLSTLNDRAVRTPATISFGRRRALGALLPRGRGGRPGGSRT